MTGRTRPGGAGAGASAGRFAVLALMLGFALAMVPRADAQALAGVLADRETGQGIDGAVIELIGADDAQLSGTLTDAAGRFRLRAPRPGTYRLRAEQVGYATVLFSPLEVPAAGIGEYRMTADVAAISLTDALTGGLGVEFPPRDLSIRGEGRLSTELAVPPGPQLIRSMCDGLPGSEAGAVVTGFVRDLRTGDALADATIRLGRGPAPAGSGADRPGGGVVEVAADALGFYRICGVPVGKPFWVEAELAGHSSGRFTLDLDGQDVVRYDLPLGAR